MHNLDQWLGRSQTLTDILSEAQVARLALTFDMPAPRYGDPLPALWHWILFPPQAAQSELGADGHPRLGGFMPPIKLPRRMWAGGRLIFRAPLRIGETITRFTKITSISEKQGKSGVLNFLTLHHTLSNASGICVEEEQDIVYREHGVNAQPPRDAEALPSAAWREVVDTDPRLLFRYSAVTFNTHRIHYDLPYARDVECYPDLVVQGPLTATLLANALVRHVGRPLTAFSFRGLAPLFAGQAMHVCGEPDGTEGTYRLWAEGAGNCIAMSASAQLAVI
ncbi:HTD2 family dehydratase [Sinorhizobium medicae]|uniref:FAS1-like dehydratase domain-containing protein n=1 Tax=Sinorhizobium medicae TaxID=110321 RepID=UPI000FD88F11|nr:MaoC family dehydratase N-terminal domain-containing protein [Sinorhizobium medicae]RVO73516.1 acyl-CoA dehydrogenase [Sinorhizobium medicae]